MTLSDKELSEMIADLMHTDRWPPRERLCLALIELRALLQTHKDMEHMRSAL